MLTVDKEMLLSTFSCIENYREGICVLGDAVWLHLAYGWPCESRTMMPCCLTAYGMKTAVVSVPSKCPDNLKGSELDAMMAMQCDATPGRLRLNAL